METLEKTTAPAEIKAGSNLPEKHEAPKPGETAAGKEDVSPALSGASFTTFWTWRGNGTAVLTFFQSAIKANSRLFVSLSEFNSDAALNRFVGDATMAIYNVAPFNGGFKARCFVGWNTPLNVRFDVLIDP